MKKGFTLLEMLVVIGIIVILVGASVGAFAKMTRSADRAKGQELVDNTATALTALFTKEGAWPRALRTNGAKDGELNAEAAYPLAKGGYMTLSTSGGRLTGLDRFGIVTPWGLAHLKNRGLSASLGDRVGAGTLKDHVLHYALDLDGDGIIEGASVGGESVDVRATAIVWSVGPSGKVEAYSRGLRGDGIYSWTKGQTNNVK